MNAYGLNHAGKIVEINPEENVTAQVLYYRCSDADEVIKRHLATITLQQEASVRFAAKYDDQVKRFDEARSSFLCREKGLSEAKQELEERHKLVCNEKEEVIKKLAAEVNDHDAFMAFMTESLAEMECRHGKEHPSTPPMMWPELIGCVVAHNIEKAEAVAQLKLGIKENVSKVLRERLIDMTEQKNKLEADAKNWQTAHFNLKKAIDDSRAALEERVRKGLET